ncbi:MAG: DUF4065 domain-containing protein [Acetobacter sp.]|nr:DUF4065 domain-containing protein [Acetobacter sp.]
MMDKTCDYSQTPFAPSTAIEVANEFLTLGFEESIDIDQMKLQKLVYYAQAWFLALKQRPLFEEDIEAWPWGPVIRDIYIQTQGYGRNPVVRKLSQLQPKNNDPLDCHFDMHIPKGVSERLKAFIRKVWDVHKNYTGIQLSNSTHAEGEPWSIVSEKYQGDLRQKPTIPNALIKAVFTNKVQHGRSALKTQT